VCRGCEAARRAQARQEAVAQDAVQLSHGHAFVASRNVPNQEKLIALLLNGWGLTAHEIGTMNAWLHETAHMALDEMIGGPLPPQLVVHGEKLQGIIYGLWLAKVLDEFPEPDDHMGHDHE
jgi:hypothetical protein